ncbi:hypothetical protein C8Q78DRAFT_52881 [Trametes maxima]|nr:hypothetical protein C8Q78DRAFT_52881 [Trametes maxima]
MGLFVWRPPSTMRRAIQCQARQDVQRESRSRNLVQGNSTYFQGFVQAPADRHRCAVNWHRPPTVRSPFGSPEARLLPHHRSPRPCCPWKLVFQRIQQCLHRRPWRYTSASGCDGRSLARVPRPRAANRIQYSTDQSARGKTSGSPAPYRAPSFPSRIPRVLRARELSLRSTISCSFRPRKGLPATLPEPGVTVLITTAGWHLPLDRCMIAAVTGRCLHRQTTGPGHAPSQRAAAASAPPHA